MNRYVYIIILSIYLFSLNCGQKKDTPSPDIKEEIKEKISLENDPYDDVSGDQFYKLEESLDDIQKQIDQLKTRISEYEYNPSEINYRANIEALKRIGVEKIISISAVGSLKEEHEPGKFVVIDQYIDRTYKRKSTFFEGGCVAHVPFGDPVCDSLSNSVISSFHDVSSRYCVVVPDKDPTTEFSCFGTINNFS